jgi:Phenazine biosynthesis-like protein
MRTVIPVGHRRGRALDVAEILHYGAFSIEGRGGNLAGVVLDAHGLSVPDMTAIAAGIGYSETAPQPSTERHGAGGGSCDRVEP